MTPDFTDCLRCGAGIGNAAIFTRAVCNDCYHELHGILTARARDAILQARAGERAA